MQLHKNLTDPAFCVEHWMDKCELKVIKQNTINILVGISFRGIQLLDWKNVFMFQLRLGCM